MFNLKTILFLTVYVAITVNIAYAETLTVGSYAIRYSVPEEYIELNIIDNKNEADNHYVSLFTELYKMTDASFVSLFMKREHHEKLTSNLYISEYATIFYINDLADMVLSDTDFLLLKKEIGATFSQKKVTMDLNGISINVSDQTVLKDEPNIFSFSQITMNNNEQMNATFTVTNMVNIEGTVLNICYVSQIKSQADIDVTLSNSDFFVKNLSLKPVKNQRPAPSSTTATAGVTRVAKPLLLIFGGVTSVMALLLGGLFFFLNRDKKMTGFRASVPCNWPKNSPRGFFLGVNMCALDF